MSWMRLILSGFHMWPGMWSSLIVYVLCMGKKKPCYTQKCHCTHCLSQKNAYLPHSWSSKCSLYYKIYFHSWGIIWRNLQPFIFSCISISHDPNSVLAHSKNMLSHVTFSAFRETARKSNVYRIVFTRNMTQIHATYLDHNCLLLLFRCSSCYTWVQDPVIPPLWT